MTMAMDPPPYVDPALLVDGGLFDRLVARVVEDNDFAPDYAGRVVRQALAFLATCATNPAPLTPSKAVDAGWHAFLLYTKDYAAFCGRIAGGFIHHVPTDTGQDGRGASLEETTDAIRSRGFEVDIELWYGQGGRCQKCSNCHQCHAGCHDSP